MDDLLIEAYECVLEIERLLSGVNERIDNRFSGEQHAQKRPLNSGLLFISLITHKGYLIAYQLALLSLQPLKLSMQSPIQLFLSRSELNPALGIAPVISLIASALTLLRHCFEVLLSIVDQSSRHDSQPQKHCAH